MEAKNPGNLGEPISLPELDYEFRDLVRQLNDLALARGQTLAQMALAWVLRHPGMTSVLIGASSVEQLEENLAALEHLDFTDEELSLIDRYAVEVGAAPAPKAVPG